MEYRRLGRSGLMVPALSLGTGTFGGVGRLAAWGTTDATDPAAASASWLRSVLKGN